MPTKQRVLPSTMTSPETGAVLVRAVRSLTITYKGESMTVEVPGYFPEEGGVEDGVLIGPDMAPADAALRTLKEKVDGLPAPATIRRLRKKLSLSQREAGALFRVGEKAFDKYERGLIEPSGPTIQLLKLLDRHPELLDDLR